MFRLNVFKSIAEQLHGFRPRRFANRAIVTIANERRRCPVIRLQDTQRFPALRASHPQIDGVVSGRCQIDRLAILDMDLESTACRAVAANHIGSRIWNHCDWQCTEAKGLWF